MSLDEARRQFELPYDKDVQAELNAVQREQRPGSEIYRFSHPSGTYDNRFWVIAIAVYIANAGPDRSKIIVRPF